MTVLVLAQECDAPVDHVVWQLSEHGVPVFRVDLSWFPQRLAVAAEFRDGGWSGELRTNDRTVSLADIRSIWYRDPSAFEFPAGLTDVERAHAHREARLGLGGVLATLPVLWVNHPNRAADAMYKPLQLATAARCGLTVPRTLVTNNSQAVRRFARAAPSGIVGKTLGANTVTEGDQVKVAYTHRLDDADLADLRGVDVTAHQLQEWADKDHEVRVVVVGNHVFGIAIYAGSAESHIDWRTDFDALTYATIDPPPHVRKGLRRYLAMLGLVYAAFDFVVTPNGRWVFLESNSSGQYAWLESATGAPISATLVDLLSAGCPA